MLIPKYLQIETINGACPANCSMCPIRSSRRPIRVMDMAELYNLMLKFFPYKDVIQYVSLFGLGEPLADKDLPEKIALVKHMKFKGIGVSTNCWYLDKQTSERLISSGLDTLICSIDGFEESHKKIRGLDYIKVINNVHRFIRLAKGKVRVVVRMIVQDVNNHEVGEFKRYWEQYAEVLTFPKHNWALKETADRKACSYINERLYIHSNGNLALCCNDYDGWYNNGNAFKKDPVKLWNKGKFEQYRNGDCPHCKDCDIAR